MITTEDEADDEEYPEIDVEELLDDIEGMTINDDQEMME